MSEERWIDPNDERFQQGRYLYEAQVLHADSCKGPVEPERVKQVCERYCQLIGLVGPLRSECNRLDRSEAELRKRIEEVLRGVR